MAGDDMGMDMDMDMDMSMAMYLTWSSSVVVWFQWWDTNGSPAAYCCTLIILFGVSILFEAWSSLANGFSAYFTSSFTSVPTEDQERQETLLQEVLQLLRNRLMTNNTVMLFLSVLYTVKFVLAYAIMLAAMTYNAGVLIAIFSGVFVGHFVFSRFGYSKNMPISGNASLDVGCH